MKTEYKRVVAQASEEALARWILKNLDWSGGNDDANGAFLTSILLEHRRQSAVAEEKTPFPAGNWLQCKSPSSSGSFRTGPEGMIYDCLTCGAKSDAIGRLVCGYRGPSQP